MIKYCNVTRACVRNKHTGQTELRCKYIIYPSSQCTAPENYVCKMEQEDLRNAEKWFAEQRKRAKRLSALID